MSKNHTSIELGLNLQKYLNNRSLFIQNGAQIMKTN